LTHSGQNKESIIKTVANDPKRTSGLAGVGQSAKLWAATGVGEAKRINAMVDITLKTEEEILAFDVSDEALEIAAGTVSDKANFTFGVCTANQAGCPGWLRTRVKLFPLGTAETAQTALTLLNPPLAGAARMKAMNEKGGAAATHRRPILSFKFFPFKGPRSRMLPQGAQG
jgi:hypothetical protein